MTRSTTWFASLGFLAVTGCNTAQPKATRPDVAVDLPELVDDFKANEVAAASKYADRYVVTSGTVQNMGAYGSGFYVIFSDGDRYDGQCYTSQRDKVEALRKGASIRVRARATTHIIYLQLKDCTIM